MAAPASFHYDSKWSPAELIEFTLTALQQLEQAAPEAVPASLIQKLESYLAAMKLMVQGDEEHQTKAETIEALCIGLMEQNALLAVLRHLQSFQFQARKDFVAVFSTVLRLQRQKAIEHILQNAQILTLLVKGYEAPEITLDCGSILRECIRHQPLCEMVLNTPDLFNAFFGYLQLSSFDVAADAFLSFKLMLTKHKPVAAKFLDANFDKVFPKYNSLLESQNYVTVRQSLKLLSDLLLERVNMRVMMKYISSAANLKILLNLLWGRRKAIHYEAFHVLKIFVANPNKTKPVMQLLAEEKERLIAYLDNLESKDDEQLTEEKGMLLASLQKLPPASSFAQAAAAPAGPAGAAPSTSTPAPAPAAAGALSPKAAAAGPASTSPKNTSQ